MTDLCMKLNRCYIYFYIYLFSDPCFAKECSQSERCGVTSADKTTCSKFDFFFVKVDSHRKI